MCLIMNLPVPEVHKDSYTAVLDGGSLEHIFNFPVAIKNCMEMLKVDGQYLGITPVNNSWVTDFINLVLNYIIASFQNRMVSQF